MFASVSLLRILWSILIPLAMPAIVAAGLLGIIMSWNYPAPLTRARMV